MNLAMINARLAAVDAGHEFRAHGDGRYYKVGLNWKGEGRGFDRDGVRILNSAMGWQWVLDDVALWFRDQYRRFVWAPAAEARGADAAHYLLKGI